MPIESIICRRNLDEQRGNPQICECPMCRERGKDGNESISNSERGGRIREAQTTGNISEGQEQRDSLQTSRPEPQI